MTHHLICFYLYAVNLNSKHKWYRQTGICSLISETHEYMLHPYCHGVNT